MDKYQIEKYFRRITKGWNFLYAYLPRHEEVGSGDEAPQILYRGTRRDIISLLHAPAILPPGIHCVGDWLGSIDDLDAVVKCKVCYDRYQRY